MFCNNLPFFLFLFKKLKCYNPRQTIFCNVSKEIVSDREAGLCRYPALLGRDATLLKIIKRARIKVVISHLQVFSRGFEFVCDWSLNITVKSIGDIHSLVIMRQNHCALYSSKMEPSDACYETFIITVCCCWKLLCFLFFFFPKKIRLYISTKYLNTVRITSVAQKCNFQSYLHFHQSSLVSGKKKITLNCMTKCIGCLWGCIKA